MTPDAFFWPENVSTDEMAARVAMCLSESPALAPMVYDPAMRLHTFIARVCQEWGVHPRWILVSLQRERSLLRGRDVVPKDFDFACGFVGSDAPGTLNPAWNGMTNQIWRCARHTAWYAGIGPKQLYGYRKGLWPGSKRWTDFWVSSPKVVVDYGKSVHPCKDVAEFIQLTYTPHLSVLEANQKIDDQFVAPFFQ